MPSEKQQCPCPASPSHTKDLKTQAQPCLVLNRSGQGKHGNPGIQGASLGNFWAPELHELEYTESHNNSGLKIVLLL